ncbi:hypothetical protein [Methylotetracoccus oryzae]|uniref:hypothetical protein n=1 Tax=Methylotetracoccus oryzae TaxID=1919059 RepID=UPI00111B6659|nr:hypothetical protein [Methylotetracoccus oryzae]
MPTGIVYARGVQANAPLFEPLLKDGRIHTRGIWFCDIRTDKPFTRKPKPLKFWDLQDCIACCQPENRRRRKSTERFKYFGCKEPIARQGEPRHLLAEVRQLG